ncbi:uncharacterized protein N7483_006130 [Penicillium malachiteum]|uniref:uncharacterized protein n=1 Tax=Penicillium malachiteum TaxID=1324776 RepID=UPI0025498561|nr:uncharacterized protein N7483_006130 [Penicillium malachiteum]KAJ5731622.1 hypothetical protein N7483_006130 [Penicillium malachiteum]
MSINADNHTAEADRYSSANSPEDVPSLVTRISSFGPDINCEDRKERSELLDAARSLVAALETPAETSRRHIWLNPATFAAIMTALDLGVFPLLALNGKPKTALDLATATNSDPVLLARILKHLGAMGVLFETGTDEYCATNLSSTLAVDKYSDGYRL